MFLYFLKMAISSARLAVQVGTAVMGPV